MHALRMVEHSHADASSTAMNHSALSGFRLSTLLRFIIFFLPDLFLYEVSHVLNEESDF